MITDEQLDEEEKKLTEDFNHLFRHRQEVQGELDSIVKRLVQIQGAIQFIGKLKQKSLPLESAVRFPEVTSSN